MSVDLRIILWEKFKSGDWNAYSTLYKEYFPLLNNYGSKFTKDTALIEDAVHDLFVRLWTTKEKLSTPPSVKNYLLKSLRHNILRKIQSGEKVKEIQQPDNFEVAFNPEALRNMEERELQAQIKSYINGLPPRQREMIYLRFFEGLSYEDIALVMSISIGSTYKLLYKALASLQKELGNKNMMLLLCLLNNSCFFSEKG